MDVLKLILKALRSILLYLPFPKVTQFDGKRTQKATGWNVLSYLLKDLFFYIEKHKEEGQQAIIIKGTNQASQKT